MKMSTEDLGRLEAGVDHVAGHLVAKNQSTDDFKVADLSHHVQKYVKWSNLWHELDKAKGVIDSLKIVQGQNA